jgi:protein SCO1/2
VAATVRRAADDEVRVSTDLNSRAVVCGGVGVIVAVVLIALVAHFLTSASGPARSAPTDTSSDEPKVLRSDPVAERLTYESETNARLASYGWVDREHGIAHIPVERAMELQVAEDPAPARTSVQRPIAEWDQRLGAPLPLELAFADEKGRSVRLADYFGATPVVIVFVYFRCEKLCPATLGGVDEVLRSAGLVANRDYRLLAVSIDPRDTPAQAAQRAQMFASQGMHVLTSSTGNAALLANAAGFSYAMTSDDAQFAHPAGFLIATPQGTISRYFFGVRYAAPRVRNAVESARDGVTGGLTDRLMMVCFGLDDAHEGRSAWLVVALRTLTIAFLGVLAIVGWRKYSRRARR